MNYRHAFHAGNHTEVFKHAALVLLLERLLEKPQPFTVLDTHAGIGMYDLGADQAQRTGEFQEGVGRVFGTELVSAPGYSRLIAELNPDGLKAYPGSPEIVRRFLRPEDRLIACELHPQDADALKGRYRADRRVSVHHRDGYEAIGALLPPKARRGLVLIDPPYEQRDEAERLSAAVSMGLKRWSTGMFMAWYPVKDPAISRTLARAAVTHPYPKALRVELFAYADGESSLPGSGLIICNTPWKLDGQLAALCRELIPRLGSGRGHWTMEWLTPG